MPDPDESSDNDQPWRMPAGRPGPAHQEELGERGGLVGRLRATRPVGPATLRAWSRRPYLIAAVAVAALLGGAGAALATTGSGTHPVSGSAVAVTPTPSPSPPGPPGVAGPGYRRFGAFAGHGIPFAALHGQFVVARPGGGYQTVDVQEGQVTAVSTTSITIKSADGFTKSYVVAGSTLVDAQRDGIGSVKTGNQASVIATVSGGTATATIISDLTLVQQGRTGLGYWRASSGGSGPQAG